MSQPEAGHRQISLAAVARQVQQLKPGIFQTFGQAAEKARMHGPAVQQGQGRAIARLVNQQVH